MVLQNLLIRNNYLVERGVGASISTGQRISFVDIPTLRNVRMFALEAISETELTKAPSGATAVSLTGLAGAIITINVKAHGISSGGSEDIYQFPLYDLNPTAQKGLIRWFDGVVIDLPKSYITILDTTNISANESFLFNFIYRK